MKKLAYLLTVLSLISSSALADVSNSSVDANVTNATLAVTQSGSWSVSQSGTWTVQPGNTANTTAWLVTGTGGTFPSTQSGTWTVQPGNTANTTPWLTTINQGGNSAAVTASNALKVDGSAVTQPVSGTVTANQGGTWTVQPGNTANTTAWLINVGQFGGTNVVTGTGASGSGIPRVTVSNDSQVRLLGNAGAIVDAAQNAAAPANLLVVGGVFNTTPPTVTSGNAGSLQIDSDGTLLVQVKEGNVASGATDSGNPVKVGGVFNTTQTAVTNGQRADIAVSAFGDVSTADNTKFSHLTANATTTIKSGSGLLYKICVNDYVSGASVTVYDNTAGSGTVIAIITAQGSAGTSAFFTGNCNNYGGVQFGTGLTVVLAGGPSDYTITYK